MAGITFRIGGALDPTYAGALNRAVAEAKLASVQIQKEYAAAQALLTSFNQRQEMLALKTPRASSSTILNAVENKSAEKEYAESFGRLLQADAAANAEILASNSVLHAKLSVQQVELTAELAAEKDVEVAMFTKAELDKVIIAKAAAAQIIAAQLSSGTMLAAEQNAEVLAATASAGKRIAIFKASQNAEVAALASANAEKNLINEIQLKKYELQMAQEVAATKAAQLAEITMVARRGGIGAASGDAGHKYGGKGGVISEIAVIGHELLQGRGFGRVLGSISILAQRLGFLGTLVKSSAAEFIKAALAENVLAGSMAREVLIAEAKVIATRAAAVASGLSTAAVEAATAAEVANAAALTISTNAQILKAKKAVETAEIMAATAKVTLGPIGWILIAVTVLAGGFFLLAHHASKVAERIRNLAEMLDPLRKKFTDQADAMREVTKEAQEYARWLLHLGEQNKSLADSVDEAITKMREQAQAYQEVMKARGASDEQIEKMQIKQLEREQAFLTAAKKQAGEQASAAVEKSNKLNPLLPEEKAKRAEAIDTDREAKRVAKNAGEILDAVQEKYEAAKKSDIAYNKAAQSPIPVSTEETKFHGLKVGNKELPPMSFAEAKKTFDELSTKAEVAATALQKLKDNVDDAKKSAEDKVGQDIEIGKKLRKVADQISVAKEKASTMKPIEAENIRREKFEDSLKGMTKPKQEQALRGEIASQKKLANQKVFEGILDPEAADQVGPILNRVEKLQNLLNQKELPQKGGGRGGIGISEWERAGGSMGGGVALLDIAKQQLRATMKTNHILAGKQFGGGRRVNHGGT